MIKQEFIYNDRIYFLIFDEITYKLFEDFSDIFNQYNIIIYNGYLARQYGDIDKIEYFHRFIHNIYFKSYGKNFEIHHINKNKLDNRFTNLRILTKEEHKKFHKKM